MLRFFVLFRLSEHQKLMKKVILKPRTIGIRTVLVAALALVVSAGLVDGMRKYKSAKAAAEQTETDLRASLVVGSRS